MRAVVRGGTGAAAADPRRQGRGQDRHRRAAHHGQAVPTPDASGQIPPQSDTTPQDDASDTDAWFTAFAPLTHPRVAVGVLLVGQGAGGATAAPAARDVLEAALKRG